MQRCNPAISSYFIQFCSNCFKTRSATICNWPNQEGLKVGRHAKSYPDVACIYPHVDFLHFSPDSREFGWSLSYHALSKFLCPNSMFVRVADVALKGIPGLLLAYQRDCVPLIWLFGYMYRILQTSQSMFPTGL